MPSKNLHSQPFDEATLTKLEIFREFLTEWLPVFIYSPNTRLIKIYDFFAGEGQDPNGIPGSPIIILRVIHSYKNELIGKNKKIRVLLNEYDSQKFSKLQKLVNQELASMTDLNQLLIVDQKNCDFALIFDKEFPNLKFGNSLIFLDQNGIKHITKEVFLKLSSFPKTDFLFFISSSYFNRFDFKEYHPDLLIEGDFKHSDIHRKILEYYRGLLPNNTNLKLYPFTLKKPKYGNIYGLIFGSRHPTGIEKFLNVAWNTNKINGEANFDIDEDLEKKQDVLPFEKINPTKIDKFKENLKKIIISKGSITNKEILDYALECGHPPKHATDVLIEMRKCKKLCHFSHPKVSSKQVYAKNNFITFEVN
jgi:three-Cys-motif partner protein